MSEIDVRDMGPEDEKYVASCSHYVEPEPAELDECCRRRLQRLKALKEHGLRVKIARLHGEYAGLIYVLPIEECPWCPTGKGLAALPCMFVHRQPEGHGVGRALLGAAEDEARNQGKKGLVLVAYRHDFWAVDPAFFEQLGYRVAGHQGQQVMMWKALDPTAEPPKLLRRNYRFKPVRGKVVVDLFYNTFCRPSTIEAQRVREVSAEFGGKVVLNEYCADDRDILLRHGIPRGIFINGKEVSWGYEAPKEGLLTEIAKAVSTSVFR